MNQSATRGCSSFPLSVAGTTTAAIVALWLSVLLSRARAPGVLRTSRRNQQTTQSKKEVSGIGCLSQVWRACAGPFRDGAQFPARRAIRAGASCMQDTTDSHVQPLRAVPFPFCLA